jgi:predicted component of viral defense system (DUF524 family)
MHAYKDAVRGRGARVASVWVLYPGTEFRFFAEDETKVESPETLPVALFGRALRGVGAIPLMPSDSTGSQLPRAVLRAAVFRC